MAETIHVRGEGGAILTMDLPLPEGIAERYEKGLLPRVHSDGSPYHRQPAPAAEAGTPLTTGVTPRPGKNANKAEWLAWALAVHGRDSDSVAAIEEMTKAQLAELPDEPARSGDDEGGTDSDLTGGRPARPSEDAPKSEWIRAVVARGLLSADDAENYTKDDLIDMVR